jgi:hypothetical protein
MYARFSDKAATDNIGTLRLARRSCLVIMFELRGGGV